MAELQTNLLIFYKGWDNYQELLIKALAPLSNEQLALRAAPHLRTIGENAVHIVATRVGWFHMLMGEGDKRFAGMEEWDLPGAPARSAQELITDLQETWQMIHNALARWTRADLDKVFEETSDNTTKRFSRQWVLWHVIEHDLHHGGEISLTLGMHNLTAPDL